MTADLWDIVDDERRDVLAFLDSLTVDEHDHDSLCHGWRVREVVSHLVWVPTASIGSLLVPMVRSGFSVDRMIDREAKHGARHGWSELRKLFAQTIGDRRLPPKTSVTGMLADVLVHHQDMRRPLGHSRHIHEDRLRLVLEYTLSHAGSRAKGLTWKATDLLFEQGRGPAVEGPAEALIMVLSGRKAPLTELTGLGFEPLAARLAGSSGV
jgi:uncharacterized protein (TIGR03083 family)